MKPYKIHRLTVRQTLGVPAFDADLEGKSAIVTAGNAGGKTSILQAIATTLGLGNSSLATLAPVEDGKPSIDPATGEPFVPEVCLILRGDGPDLRVRAEGKDRTVEEQEGSAWRRVKAPVGSLLGRLVDPLANPVAFLAAKPDQQIAWILEATPCEGYSRADMLAGALMGEERGMDAFPLKPIQTGLHPLDDIEAVFGQVFAFRTDVGRGRDLAKSTAERLLVGIPATEPEDVSDAILRADQERASLADRVSSERARAKADYDRACAEATREAQHASDVASMEFEAASGAAERDFEGWVAEQRAALERRITERKAELDVRLDALATTEEDARKAARGRERVVVKAAEETLTHALDDADAGAVAVAELSAKLAAMREQQKSVAIDRDRRSEARKAEAEANAEAARYAALTRALDSIKAYRAQLASSIPIPGLEIRLGEKREVLVDGVPWRTVNTSRRAEVALRLSMLRAPQSGDGPRAMVALMDDAEHFDKESVAAIVKAAEDAGVQLILAEVRADGGPLEVRS